jgi:hypothetical protein
MGCACGLHETHSGVVHHPISTHVTFIIPPCTPSTSSLVSQVLIQAAFMDLAVQSRAQGHGDLGTHLPHAPSPTAMGRTIPLSPPRFSHGVDAVRHFQR